MDNSIPVVRRRKIRQDWAFPLVNTLFLILLMFITLYPVLNTVAYSFNDGTDALRGNIGLWPRKFSVDRRPLSGVSMGLDLSADA